MSNTTVGSQRTASNTTMRRYMVNISVYRLYGTVCLILSMMMVVSGICHAQAIEPEALFKRGLARFQQKKYVSARLDFSEIITHHPSSDRVIPALVMLSKTFYNLEDYDSAEATVNSLERSHPDSRYIDWADYMIAACRFRQGRTRESLAILAELAGTTEDESLKQRALAALRHTLLPVTDADTFNAVLEEYGLQRSDIDAAETPSEEFEEQTRRDTPVHWSSREGIKIGLLAPLSGIYAPDGEELHIGVAAALSNYREINGAPVELIVEDTESNPIQAVLKARKLIKSGVIAVIGPVYGESTITAALECNVSGIPFIAPTAPDIGIPNLGDYVFQLNYTPAIQGENLADFAARTLGFTNAAVIASNDWWGVSIAGTFSSEFEKRNGVILSLEYYEPNVSRFNYNDILMKIRAAAPESEAEADSMMVFDYGNAFADTVIVKPDPRMLHQRMKPVDSIDCILVSALPDDAVNIVRQIRDYQIRTVLLGDTGWSDESVAQDLGQYGDGSYLISNATEPDNGFGSAYFTDDYSSRKAQLPSITSKKGYDAGALLIHCLAQGATHPDVIRDRLESVKDFIGLSARYTMDQERHINTAIDFVQFRDGKPTGLQRIGMMEESGAETENPPSVETVPQASE